MVAFTCQASELWRSAGLREPSPLALLAAGGVRREPVLGAEDGQMQGVWRGRQHLPPCLGQLPKGTLTDRYSLLPRSRDFTSCFLPPADVKGDWLQHG